MYFWLDLLDSLQISKINAEQKKKFKKKGKKSEPSELDVKVFLFGVLLFKNNL